MDGKTNKDPEWAEPGCLLNLLAILSRKYLLIHTHTHTTTNTHTHTLLLQTHTHTHTHTTANTHTHTHYYKHTHTHTYTHTYLITLAPNPDFTANYSSAIYESVLQTKGYGRWNCDVTNY